MHTCIQYFNEWKLGRSIITRLQIGHIKYNYAKTVTVMSLLPEYFFANRNRNVHSGTAWDWIDGSQLHTSRCIVLQLRHAFLEPRGPEFAGRGH